MPTRSLRNEFSLPVPARVVFDHVRDPRSYVGLSPLVIAVSDIEPIEGGYRYRAVERVPVFASWTVDNPLRITLLGEGDDERVGRDPAGGDPAGREAALGDGGLVVHGEVESKGGIHVDYRYEITPDGIGCRVVDVVTLRTPLGLAGFSASRARAVQLARPGVLAERLITAEHGL